MNLVIGGTIAALELFTNPVTSIALSIAGLTITKDAGIGMIELFKEFKEGKTNNSFHYLMKLKKRNF